MSRILSLAILGTFAALTTAQAAEPRITYLEPISLQSGINRIPAFAPDGREGIVVIGWRENGNAHSFDLALVLLRGNKGGPWNVVRVEPAMGDQAGTGADVITDDLHTDDDMVQVFRLARGLPQLPLADCDASPRREWNSSSVADYLRCLPPY
jgi:hypothetical protein